VILASDSAIYMGVTLPAGAIVIGGKVSYAALGTPCPDLTIGDDGDSDRYLTATQTSTAATVVFPNTVGGTNYTVTGTTDNIIKISLSASASGAIKLETMYIVD